MKKYYALLITLFFINSAYGQGETAVPFLTLQQSPLLIGAGGIGTAIPTNDPVGHYYNPALLGNYALKNNFGVTFMPNKTDWMPGTFPYHFQSFGVAAGYNFLKDSIPLSIGLGYIHNKISFGQFLRINPNSPEFHFSSDVYDIFDCFSIGVSYDYLLLFSLGISVKSYTSELGNQFIENKLVETKTSGTAFDFGAMVTTPISKLFFDNYKINIGANSAIQPKTDLTIGYSLTNIGKKLYYIDPAQADPLPRTARLGYSLNFALELSSNSIKKLNLIDYSFSAEANDILVIRDNALDVQYQNILGDISIGKNLIELKGDQSVIVHKGHILKLFDTVIITSGSFYGRGYLDTKKTNGIGFSSDGLLKLLSESVDNPVINYISSHFVIEYYNTYSFVDSCLETNFKGVVLNYRGVEF